jgi:hypothetical protein
MQTWYHLPDVLKALELLAAADATKEALWKRPSLVRVVKKVTKSGSALEREAAISLLWAIAFGTNVTLMAVS